MDPERGRIFKLPGRRHQNYPLHSKRIHYRASFTLGFPASNNEAKYEAVLVGLQMAITLGVTGLEVHCDSLSVVNQVSGEYIARDTRMAEYLQLVLELKSKIPR